MLAGVSAEAPAKKQPLPLTDHWKLVRVSLSRLTSGTVANQPPSSWKARGEKIQGSINASPPISWGRFIVLCMQSNLLVCHVLCREHCPRFWGGCAPVKLGFRLQKKQSEGTEVVSDVGRSPLCSRVGMGGRWGLGVIQALEHWRALSKLNTGGGCLLLNHVNNRDGFCDPAHRSKCSEQKLQGRPLQEGCFFLGLYMHQSIVNTNNLQLSEQTNYKPVSFGYLLSNDYAELFIKRIQKSQTSALCHVCPEWVGSDALSTHLFSQTALFPALLLLRGLCSRQPCRSVAAVWSPSKPATEKDLKKKSIEHFHPNFFCGQV